MIRRRSALLALLLAAACRQEHPARTPIILISIDTLRSDHLPAYGYRGVETPAIDAFRRDSVLFTHAYSHVPLTLPSHATMLTGRLPAQNGLRDNVGFRLDPKVPTVAELLRKAGYRTGAAVSAFVMRGETGLSRGFETYDDHMDAGDHETPIGLVQRSGAVTEGVAERWIGEHEGEPFFFMLHLYEPHTPYAPPEPFRTRFKLPYDGEIATADAIVGRFLQFLRTRKLYENALIILVSDHGEGLGDHGEDEHGIFVYREDLQVPAMVKLPMSRGAGGAVTEPVQLSDVFPTILQQAGLGRDAYSLIDAADHGGNRNRVVYSESQYPRYHFGWSDLHSAISSDHQAIRAPQPELYDLRSDLAERHNLIDSDRRTWNLLDAVMAPLIAAPGAPSAVSAEESAKLAALGYLSSSTSASDEGVLPDPKVKIGDFREIKSAFVLYREGKYPQATIAFRHILVSNPRMVDVWEMLSRSLAASGQAAESVAAAKEGLRVGTSAPQLAISVANQEIESDPDDAAKHAVLALRLDPVRAHEILARLALNRGDLTKAEQEGEAALAAGGEHLQPLLTLARVKLRQGDATGALQRLDQASQELHGSVAPAALALLRGDALARLGRGSEAEAAFREAVRIEPGSPEAYQSLIVLLTTEGRTDEATRLVYTLARSVPTPAGYAAIVKTLETLGDHDGARYWSAQAKRMFTR